MEKNKDEGSVEYQSFCFGCGKKIDTLEERYDNHCKLCVKRYRSEVFVFGDAIRSIDRMMRRTSSNSGRGRVDDD